MSQFSKNLKNSWKLLHRELSHSLKNYNQTVGTVALREIHNKSKQVHNNKIISKIVNVTCSLNLNPIKRIWPSKVIQWKLFCNAFKIFTGTLCISQMTSKQTCISK